MPQISDHWQRQLEALPAWVRAAVNAAAQRRATEVSKTCGHPTQIERDVTAMSTGYAVVQSFEHLPLWAVRSDRDRREVCRLICEEPYTLQQAFVRALVERDGGISVVIAGADDDAFVLACIEELWRRRPIRCVHLPAGSALVPVLNEWFRDRAIIARHHALGEGMFGTSDLSDRLIAETPDLVLGFGGREQPLVAALIASASGTNIKVWTPKPERSAVGVYGYGKLAS